MSEHQVERVCTIIRNQANRCITMVEELLSVARGEKKFRFEILPLNEVLSEIEFMLQAETERHKVSLKTSFNYAGQVRVDKAKLMRVIFNLTNNALEILKAGGQISIESQSVDQGWVEIAIADTGPGIPPELAQTLFQPFATFGKSKGTGLGLYIAREIIHDHGGSISLDKNYQGGARFVIRLKQET
jgi:signal transduction histidine kinase